MEGDAEADDHGGQEGSDVHKKADAESQQGEQKQAGKTMQNNPRAGKAGVDAVFPNMLALFGAQFCQFGQTRIIPETVDVPGVQQIRRPFVGFEAAGAMLI